MNLRAFRKLFIETSGRYDLVNDDGSDNGANYYINQGIRHLETITYWDKMQATKYITLAGDSTFMVKNLRTIDTMAVRLSDTEKFTELVRINLQQARKYVMDSLGYEGVPLFYCVFRSRGEHEALSVVENFFIGTSSMYQDVLEGQNFDSVGVLLLPLLNTAATATVEVTGMVRSETLVDDDDENYWTVQWPNVLLYAARREMEIQHRNMQGVRDWDAAIAGALTHQEMDFIMDESNQISRMEG